MLVGKWLSRLLPALPSWLLPGGCSGGLLGVAAWGLLRVAGGSHLEVNLSEKTQESHGIFQVTAKELLEWPDHVVFPGWEGNFEMAILNAVRIQPRSAEVWPDLQKLLKKGTEIINRHGGENVTVVVSMNGPTTNELTVLATAEDWAKYGQVQKAVYDDPEMQALLLEAGKISRWEIYTYQTLDL